MGNNATMATANIAMSANSIGSAYLQSSAYSAQGEYQAKMYEMNAKIADLQGKDAIKRGDENVAKLRSGVKKILGSQRVGLAAQNIDIQKGNAVDVQADTAEQAKLDEIAIRNNAWREAWGYKVDAIAARAGAQNARNMAGYQSNMSLLTGGMNAIGYGARAYEYAFPGSPSTSRTRSQILADRSGSIIS